MDHTERNRLFASLEPLITKHAKSAVRKYVYTYQTYDEALSDCNYGALLGLERYDPSKGNLENFINKHLSNYLKRQVRNASEVRSCEIQVKCMDTFTTVDPSHPLWEGISRLGEFERAVIVGTVEYGHTIDDLATIHGVSEKTIRRAIKSGRESLRKHLSDE